MEAASSPFGEAIVTSTAFGGVVEVSTEDRVTLEHLEEALWREETRFDRAFMERVVAEDFFEFGRSGRTYNREEILHVARQPIQAVLPLPDLKVRLLNEVTAQVTYNSVVTYGEVTEYARRSSIWSRSSDGWVLRFHQGTLYLP